VIYENSNGKRERRSPFDYYLNREEENTRKHKYTETLILEFQLKEM
jgi:hypothetical protein